MSKSIRTLDCPLRADNETTSCAPSCAWRIGDDCAVVALAKSAQRAIPEPEVRSCATCRGGTHQTIDLCVGCIAWDRWEPRT